MSISEELHPQGGGTDQQEGRPGGASDGHPRVPRPAQPAADFDRTPPQDVAAEQCVLGGMLLSKDAIADVVEILKTNDFYQPKHGVIFDAVLDLYSRGEPADLITVASALVDSGDHNRVGGATYLHTLVSSVPTAANASYYARIVADRAVLRRLIEAGTRVTQLGYGAAGGGGRDVDDVVDLAQQAVYDVTERRVSEDFAALNELLQPTLDEIEAIGANGGVMTGVPTGFTDLDRLLNGLHAGQLIIVAGRPGLGKALALDTPLPTPTGWTTMGAVQPGAELLGADGHPTRVVAATGVMHGRPCYEVEFSDGSVLVADAEHQWRTRSRTTTGTVDGVVTTAQLAATVQGADGRPRHAVALAAPARLAHRELPLDPTVLGEKLATADEGETFRIPPAYLRSGHRQRAALLAGLLSGTAVDASGTVDWHTSDAGLADDVRALVVSLGRQVTSSVTSSVTGTASGVRRHRLTFVADRVGDQPDRWRYVTDVRPVDSVPVRCVQVDSPDHLYLAGESWIPTHNSTVAMDFARSCSIRNAMSSAIFSLEMSKVEIVMRLLAAEARVPLHTLRSGQLSDDDWTKLARRMGEISDAPLFCDDTPNMNLMEIRAKARRLKQRHDIKLIVVDYLQLMSSPKRVESRQQEVAELSRGLKLLAKEVDCPVIAVSQLNRGPEQRTDKRPQLSDLRESGCLTAGTRILRADTGTETTIGELLASGATDVPVWSADGKLRYTPRTLTHAFPSGTREAFVLRLASGRSVEATANHPFLTVDGWTPLGALRPGSRVAVPRHVPAPLVTVERPDEDVVTLAQSVAGSADGVVPDEVFGLPKRQLAAFLGQLWAAAGHVAWRDGAGTVDIHYESPHRSTVDQLSLLFLRFGIQTSSTTDHTGGHRLVVGHGDDQRRFLREVAGHGSWAPSAARCLAELDGQGRGSNGGQLGPEVWARVRAALAEGDPTYRRGVPAGPTEAPRGGPRPQRLANVAAVLDEAGLDMHATNDVYWDEVLEVESIGVRPVYDATVLGSHNFVANGIAVHNSIEQDADVVLLLHREDYYDKESPRAGEADFIVAKHRNGPTDTVTVAAQLHLSRFVDMAIS